MIAAAKMRHKDVSGHQGRGRSDAVAGEHADRFDDRVVERSSEEAEERVKRKDHWTRHEASYAGCYTPSRSQQRPDDNKDKIFEPFYSTKEVGKGMGLGLSISYGIVRDYDGKISVTDNGTQGTRFELRFERTAPP